MSISPERKPSPSCSVQPTRFGQILSWLNRCHLSHILDGAIRVAVAVGSACYHLCPNNQTLVWDRLPMTVAFMSLLALVIGDRIGARAGRWLLRPLVVLGAGSVLWWRFTEAAGRGDLRLYALVQFLPMLAIPVMLLLFPARYTGTADFGWTLGWYALAKVFELLDRQIFAIGGVVSG